MKVAVMGAGAVGCYFGAMLARAGHAVTLIGRPQHVEAVNRRGLYLDSKSFQEHVPMSASTDAAAVAGSDVVSEHAFRSAMVAKQSASLNLCMIVLDAGGRLARTRQNHEVRSMAKR